MVVKQQRADNGNTRGEPRSHRGARAQRGGAHILDSRAQSRSREPRPHASQHAGQGQSTYERGGGEGVMRRGEVWNACDEMRE